MNETVQEVLEDTVDRLESQIKWASEAVDVAKRNLHGRQEELTDLYVQRNAIQLFLNDQGTAPVIENVEIHDYVWSDDDDLEEGE